MGFPCSLLVFRASSPSVLQILCTPWSATVIRPSRSRFYIVQSLQIYYHLMFPYFFIDFIFLLHFLFFSCGFALGGWCWHEVQYQRSDKGQHRDWQWIMGHSGHRRSLASNWYSSTLPRRPLPSFCTLLSPSLTCWPGPDQTEPSYLL